MIIMSTDFPLLVYNTSPMHKHISNVLINTNHVNIKTQFIYSSRLVVRVGGIVYFCTFALHSFSILHD